MCPHGCVNKKGENYMKKGFTLAEVLITLVIIGVIAAMTIPTLMNSTNQQEYRTGFKKAISALNQALSLNYALEGTMIGDSTLNSTSATITNLFKKRMSVVATSTNVAFATNSQVGVTPAATNVFYTADGMRYAFSLSTAGTFDTDSNEYYYGLFIIDVNGEKGPNTFTTTAAQPKDTYVATLYGNRVVAGIPGQSTGASQAAREVMFDKKYSAATSGAGGS